MVKEHLSLVLPDTTSALNMSVSARAIGRRTASRVKTILMVGSVVTTVVKHAVAFMES